MAGRLDEAIAAYDRALALRPDYASAHNNLGMVLQAQEKYVNALGHFREAVRLDANNVQAHRNLAWHLATDSGTDIKTAREAVAAAERAAALTDRRDAHVLDALAASYAAVGEFDRAVSAAERAMAMTADQALQREIAQRLTLYQRRARYRVR
jgi:tetratricopeptide (TPR) repeat protein